MFNPWRQLRLAGAVVGISTMFFHNFALVVLGAILIGIGTINGLLSVESRLDSLEKEIRNEKPEA